MDADAPPPVVITAPAPGEPAEGPPVYGPVDSEAPPAIEDCSEASADEIVVCRETDPEQYRALHTAPPSPTAMDEISSAVQQARVGPFEVTTGGPKNSVGLGLRIRF